MKTWITYLVAIAFGFSATLLLGEVPMYGQIISFVASIARQLGCFVLFPIVFILFSSGIASLRRRKETGIAVSSTILWGLVSTLLLCLLAVPIALAFPPLFSQIPTQAPSSSTPIQLPTAQSLLPFIISDNAFSQFSISTSLLGLMIVALFIGLSLKTEQEAIRPAYVVVNSFAEAMLHLARLFTAIGAILLFFICADWLRTTDLETLFFGNLRFFSSLGILVVVTIGILLPLLFSLFTRFQGGNPYRIIFGALPAMLAGASTGNLLFGTTALLALSQKNNGVCKRVAGTSIPLLTVFGRGGSAMVATYAIIGLIAAGSGSLPPIQMIFLTALFASLCSFVSSFYPGLEVPLIAVLTIRGLQGSYAPDMEAALLLFLPLLQAVAIFIDMAAASLGSACSSRLVSETGAVAYRDML